ncbi:MAG TPA: hypothetical protein VGD60_01945 [Candidatus Acidoferrales bacterium]
MKTGENRPNREWLLRYVLGELSEDETRAADERFFSDDEFAGTVDGEYRDLRDAYAAGEVAGSEKERVERAFFGEPEQRRQLRILEAMQALPGKSVDAARSGTGLRLFSFWPLAISAGVLSFAIAILMFQHNPRLRAITNRNAPDTAVTNQAPSEIVAPSQAPAETLYTILLLPSVSRGDEGRKTFTIPAKAQTIVLQVVLPPNQQASEFEVRLKGDGEARSFPGLAAKTIEAQKYVEFSVPASELGAEHYDLKIYGSSATGTAIEEFEVALARADESKQ